MGTEQGVTEPTPTASIFFGDAFMPLSVRKYAEPFEKKIDKHQVDVFLVNTGLVGGAYGINHMRTHACHRHDYLGHPIDKKLLSTINKTAN